MTATITATMGTSARGRRADWTPAWFLLPAVLVTAALALLGAAAISARDLDTRERGLLASRTATVVVLDLSLSIADEDYNRVRGVLRRLIEEDAPIGLVVFSDVPYELLPPGTPASELAPMLRLLIPPRLGPILPTRTRQFPNCCFNRRPFAGTSLRPMQPAVKLRHQSLLGLTSR